MQLLIQVLIFFLLQRVRTTQLCYSCYGESANSSCFLNARNSKWIDCDEGLCQTWKLYSHGNSSDIYMFERSCSGTCYDGCIDISDMGHRFTSCSTCCGSNFCNTDNNATLNGFSFCFLVLIIFIFDCFIDK